MVSRLIAICTTSPLGEKGFLLMLAQMKCSNCGAEMSNFNMSWGWKNYLVMLPIMLLGFLPLLQMTFFKGDVTKELTISDVQRRSADRSVEIVGLITNKGNRTWSGVTIEAEFFDASGAFIDEATDYRRADISANAQEHFKVTIANPPPALSDPDTKMVVKVAGGHSLPF
jgi:hypothetical protein